MVSGVVGISASLLSLVSYIVQLLGIFSIFSIIKGQLTSTFGIDELEARTVKRVQPQRIQRGVFLAKAHQSCGR